MGEGELGSVSDRPELDLDPRGPTALLGYAADDPVPAHDDAARLHHLQEFAARFVIVAVAAVERSGVDAVGAADARIHLRTDDRARVARRVGSERVKKTRSRSCDR